MRKDIDLISALLFDDFGLVPHRPHTFFPDFPTPPMPPHEFKPCKTDIVDFPDKVEIKAELPGYKKEDLKIKVENDILVLSAKKEEKKEEEKDGVVIKKEIYSGSIQKSFGLKGLDKDNISASFMDGILTLTVPKIEKEEKKERIIEIN